MTTIEGVVVKEVDIAEKDTGSFIKILEDSKIVGTLEQVAVGITSPGIIKAFHLHENQDDFWYVLSGNARVVLYDKRRNSLTYGKTQVAIIGDWYKPRTLFIPRGIAHGYQVLGNKELRILYMLNQKYNKNDELRIPYDDPEIGFDWSIKNG